MCALSDIQTKDANVKEINVTISSHIYNGHTGDEETATITTITNNGKHKL